MISLNNSYEVNKIDQNIDKLISISDFDTNIIFGHTRLITNGFSDNQPVVKDSLCAVHNGIITNPISLWKEIDRKPLLTIDSEIIVDYYDKYLNDGLEIENVTQRLIHNFEGVVCSGILFAELGKFVLVSNNGSLYVSKNEKGLYFASEKYTLECAGLQNIEQISGSYQIYDVPKSDIIIKNDLHTRNNKVIHEFVNDSHQESLLEYNKPDLRRCKKCILPDTMPFIEFNSDGICNYCENYTPRNNPKPKEELERRLEKFRRTNGPDCLVPFSGGRDSCMGLHLIVNEFNMKPITYTYDWGMVTDLGRRNISRMCSKLGIENIIVAADIHKKRENIRKNVVAWLKAPHLGMVNIFTAGDKHFFRYLEDVKKETGISLNLWGVNPLEITHFKAGFLGMPPAFAEDKVYYNGVGKASYLSFSSL